MCLTVSIPLLQSTLRNETHKNLPEHVAGAVAYTGILFEAFNTIS